jgi:hypothetical protein
MDDKVLIRKISRFRWDGVRGFLTRRMKALKKFDVVVIIGEWLLLLVSFLFIP